MMSLVEPIMDLIEERLAIIWARPGSREFFAGELRNIVQLRREVHWKRDCQYLLDILDDLRSLDGLSEEDENAIAGIRARLGGYSPEELS